MTTLLTWLAGHHVGLYLATALVAALWAVSEIVSTFAAQPVRALRTSGALLLVGLNAAFACLVLGAALATGLAPSLWTAVGVGLAWQMLIRTRINFIQPLPGEGSSEAVGFRLDEMYTRLQAFCRRQIDRTLVSERVRLIEQALTMLDLEELARRAHLVLAALLATGPADPRNYVQKILNSEMDEESKELLLVLTILDHGSPALLRDMIREAERGKKDAKEKTS